MLRLIQKLQRMKIKHLIPLSVTKTNFNSKVTYIEKKTTDVTDLIKMIDFDTKLRNIISRVTSKKMKHVEAGKKLNDDKTSTQE